MSEATAHVKALARQAVSVLKGRTGIYSTLAKGHGELSSLLSQALRTSSPSKREPLLAEIRVKLLSHARAEQRTFYKSLRSFEQTRDMVVSSQHEHRVMEELLQEVVVCEAGSEQETTALEALQDRVERQFSGEEDDLFVLAHSLLSKDEEARLDAEYAREKQAEERRLRGDGSNQASGPVVL